jgi:hypothetical protein
VLSYNAEFKTLNILWLVPNHKNELFEIYQRHLNAYEINIEIIDINDFYSESGSDNYKHKLFKRALKFDLVMITFFSNTVHLLPPELVAEVNMRIPVCLVSFDVEINLTSLEIHYFKHISGIISTSPVLKNIYPHIPHFYHPLHDLDYVNMSNSAPKSDTKLYDVSFVGNIYTSQRVKYLSTLSKQLSEYNVGIFGVGTKLGRVQTKQEVAQIYSCSKVVLNFTGSAQSSFSSPIEALGISSRQLKGRPFEIFSAGAFCFTEEYPYLDKIFDTNCMETFSSRSDLRNKLPELIHNNKKRESLIDNFIDIELPRYQDLNSFKGFLFSLTNINAFRDSIQYKETSKTNKNNDKLFQILRISGQYSIRRSNAKESVLMSLYKLIFIDLAPTNLVVVLFFKLFKNKIRRVFLQIIFKFSIKHIF